MTTREPLADDLQARLEAYSPSGVGAGEWAAVQELVVVAVGATEPASVRAAFDLMAAASRLGVWAAGEGVPLRAETLFAPTTVERFTAIGMPGATDATRATYRSHLRRVGKSVVAERWGPQATAIGHRRVQPPYSEELVARFVASARAQRGTVTAARACLYISLGAGAGLDSRDLRGISRDHIVVGDKVVVVSVVAEGRQREVPVLKRLAPHVTEAADAIEGQLLVPAGNNGVNHVYRRLRLHDLPPLVQARLRSTWLVSQMAARVPLADLLRAAGIKTARSLEDLVDYVPALAPSEAAVLLSRGGRR